jgi:hypothetical protein
MRHGALIEGLNGITASYNEISNFGSGFVRAFGNSEWVAKEEEKALIWLKTHIRIGI